MIPVHIKSSGGHMVWTNSYLIWIHRQMHELCGQKEENEVDKQRETEEKLQGSRQKYSSCYCCIVV